MPIKPSLCDKTLRPTRTARRTEPQSRKDPYTMSRSVVPRPLGRGGGMRMARRAICFAVCMAAAAGCTAGTTPVRQSSSRPAPGSDGRTISPSPQGSGLSSDAAVLYRPLRFPTLAHGAACPSTPGHLVVAAGFHVVALGNGPVEVGISGEPSDARRGITDLTSPTVFPSWLGFKTLWFSLPSYQGPWLIRAKRLDGRGEIAFASGPGSSSLYVGPGPTLNGRDGYREATGGTYVQSPGCYAWQVDGLTFSELIIVRAVLR